MLTGTNQLRALICALVSLLAVSSASAHPTFIVDTRASVSVDDTRRLSGIHVVWIFDDTYSATLIAPNGFDPEGDGILSVEERAELVAMHTNSLEDYGWFTKLVAGGGEVDFLPPDDFDAALEDSRLALNFTLRPDPALTIDEQAIVLKIFDPSFVVAFLVQPGDLALEAPAACVLETEAGTGKFSADVLTVMNVSEQEGASIAESMAPPIRVRCK